MFEWRRFLRLAGAHWAEYRRGYLWFFAVGIAIQACVWLVATGGGAHAQVFGADVQLAVYACGLVASGALFAGRYFEALGTRESALSVLMRPASGFEKFLLAFLIVGVLYPIAYTLAFQACNLPAAMLAKAANATSAHPLQGPDADFGPYLPFIGHKRGMAEYPLFLAASGLQALMVCASLYFRRLAMLKGFMLAFVLWLLVMLLAAVSDGNPGRLFAIWSGGPGAPAALQALSLLVWIGVPLLLWASAYFLVRERELQ
ncbi:MAG: hypothetical protein QM719_08050 [Thermomonas sp.]